MTDALFLVGAIIVMYGAFALLSLTQERHWTTVTRDLDLQHPAPATQVRRRLAGALGLSGGLVLCIWGNGPAFGAVLWIMCLALCAAAVAFTLAWQPRWLRIVCKFTGT